MRTGFQSTLPRGERLLPLISLPASLAISIHAPARGATTCGGLRQYSPGCYFNPRSREGSDRRNGRYRPYCPQFQSTLPRGERLPIGNLTSQLFAFQSTLPRGERPVYGRYGGRTFRDFNPRSREGSDGHYYDCSATANEFQSTLPRGERLHTRLWIMQYVIQFQSTLPRGERPAIPPC